MRKDNVMKNNLSQVFNPVIINDDIQKSTYSVDILGYLGIIGFDPVELKKGKKIYKRLLNFFDENQYDNDYIPHYLESWSLNNNENSYIDNDLTHTVSHVLVGDIDKNTRTLASKIKEVQPKNVDYEKNSNPVNYNLNPGSLSNHAKNQLLANMIEEFNNWVERYVSNFNINKRSSFIQLVKLIVAQGR